MAGIDDYSITPASNTAIAGIDVDENCAPSGVNNAFRQAMADTRRAFNDLAGKAVSSGTDTVTLTSETVYTAYADGTILGFIAGGTNTGAATLNVDGVGAKAIRKGADVALVAGDIVAGMPCLVMYDASANSADGAWMLLNPATVSGYLANVVEDTTPQLGGDLDANAFDIQFNDATGLRDDSDNEQLIFHKTASAINHIGITNAAIGNGPQIAAEGDDTDIDLKLTPKGAGRVNLDGVKWPAADGTSGQVLQTNGSGSASWETPSSGGGASVELRTASATITIPSGMTSCMVTLIGGGGGGGAAAESGGTGGNASPGGFGGGVKKLLTGLTPGNTLALTIGAGGGGGGDNSDGSAGGNTTLASGTETITTLTASGGAGGAKALGATSTTAATAGTGTNGDINVSPISGTGAGMIANYNVGAVGAFGLGASGAAPSATSQDGNPGTGKGCPGSGARQSAGGSWKHGGAGAAGVAVFEWYP